MKKENKYKKDVYRNLTLITQLAIHMMTPIFLCLAVGLFLDKYLHWHSVLIFLIVGVLSGGKNMYRLAMGTVKEDEENKKNGN